MAMPVHAGLLSINGEGLDQEPVSRLLRSLTARHGAMRVSSCPSTKLSIIHPAGSSAPVSVHDSAPDGHCLTVFDGYLHNDDDVSCMVGEAVDGATPALLITNLYRQHGVTGFRHLIGDWHLVLWDGHTRELYLASDFLGLRPLFYLQTATTLAWSTCLESLVRYGEVESRYDEVYLRAYLAGQHLAFRTPFAGASAAPAGECLAVNTAGTIRRHRLWNPPDREDIRGNGEDLALEFRRLFFQAIRTRLKHCSTAAAELSGGMDSSTIVASLHRLVSTSSPPHARVRTVSFYPETAPEYSEERFVTAVEQLTFGPGIRFPMESTSAAAVATLRPAVPIPMLCPRVATLWVASKEGCSHLFSGRVGDLVLFNSFDPGAGLADAWLESKRKALAALLSWSAVNRVPILSTAKYLVGALAGPRLLKFRMAHVYERTRFSFEHARRPTAAFCHVDADTAQSIAEHHSSLGGYVASHARPATVGIVYGVHRYAMERRLVPLGEIGPVAVTYPYLDRRLLDFILRTPANHQYGPGEPRRLMKRALGDLQPEVVTGRIGKQHYIPMYARGLRPHLESVIAHTKDLQVVQRGYVSPGILTDEAKRVISGAPRMLQPMYQLLSVERWLRQREMR